MKRMITLILLCLLVCPLTKGQVTLTIVIKDLKNDKGNVLMDFRDANDQKLMNCTGKILNQTCIITLNEMKQGIYSFKYFHDENNDERLNTYWMKAPKEGYGFSNNAKGKFGPPDFAKTLFELKRDTTVECRPVYIKF